MKILLVDDDVINNELNKFVIENTGYAKNIEIALNGEEAINLLQKKDETDTPNLIFLDLNMPIMNGFEFLEEYKNMNIPCKELTKIYILTSSRNEKDLAKAKNFQIEGYVTKPLTIEKVKTILNPTG